MQMDMNVEFIWDKPAGDRDTTELYRTLESKLLEDVNAHPFFPRGYRTVVCYLSRAGDLLHRMKAHFFSEGKILGSFVGAIDGSHTDFIPPNA